MLAFRRRVLLVEDLALPAAVRRGIGAEIVEERAAALEVASEMREGRIAPSSLPSCMHMMLRPKTSLPLPHGLGADMISSL
jgi:hypothetical protein